MGGGRKKSKKRSATSSTKPLSEFVFFIDRSLGQKVVPDALRALGLNIEVHDAHLPPDSTDEKWLRYVGDKGWIAITLDSRIRYRQNELDALIAANVCAFVLNVKNLRGLENAAIIHKAMPNLEKFLGNHEPPFVASITRYGRITMLYTHKSKNKRRSRHPDQT